MTVFFEYLLAATKWPLSSLSVLLQAVFNLIVETRILGVPKMEIQNLIEFIKEVDKLKNVERKSLNLNNNDYENSCEHSWHLALSCLLFSHLSDQQIDVLKTVKMALIHDIVEIDAGDQIIYSMSKDKFQKELNAAKRIFGLLPNSLSDEFFNLWLEFEKQESAESQFVVALDRFLPILSNIHNKGQSWNDNHIKATQVIDVNKKFLSEGPLKLWSFVEPLIENCIQKGFLAKN